MITNIIIFFLFIIIVGTFYYFNRFKIEFNHKLLITILPIILSVFLIKKIFFEKIIWISEKNFLLNINIVISFLILFFIFLILFLIGLKITDFYNNYNYKKKFLFQITISAFLLLFFIINNTYFLTNIFLIIIFSLIIVILLKILLIINQHTQNIIYYDFFKEKLNFFLIFGQFFDIISRIIHNNIFFGINNIQFSEIKIIFFLTKLFFIFFICWFLDNHLFKFPSRGQLIGFTKIVLCGISIFIGLNNFF